MDTQETKVNDNEDDESLYSALPPENPMLDAALDWARRGLYIIPIWPDDKVPLIENWQHLATRDEATIRGWLTKWPDANIGAVPERSGHHVIDLDVKRRSEADTENGIVNFNRLVEEHQGQGGFAGALVITTASGGAHLWMKGQAANSTNRVAPKIDVRGFKNGKYGQVLLPPSVIGGKPYIVETDADLAKVPPSPAWFLALNASRSNAAQAAPDVEPDDAGNIARARALLTGYVERGHVAIEFQGGDDRTYAIAAELRDLGLSADAAADLMIELWYPHCRPNDIPDFVRQKVENAYRYAQNEPGAYAATTAAEAFKDALAVVAAAKGASAPGSAAVAEDDDVVDGDEKSRLARLIERFGDADALEDANGEDLDYWDDDEGVGRGCLPNYPKGATLLAYAPTGSFKTGVILRMVLEAFVRGAKARFAEGEQAYEFGKMRVPLACRDLGVALSELTRGGKGDHGSYGKFTRAKAVPNLLDDTEVQAFIAASRAVNPNIIVLDTLSRAIPGANEDGAEVSSAVTRAVEQMRDEFKALVILIHHTGKNEKAGARGGSGLVADPDAVLRITYEKAERIVTVWVEKMRGGPAEFSKGFRVKYLDYTKRNKRTGHPVTLQVPVVEPIPDAEWAKHCAAAKHQEVRAVADPLAPPGLHAEHRDIFEALRQADDPDRLAGLPPRARRLKDVFQWLHHDERDGDKWAKDVEQECHNLARSLKNGGKKFDALRELAEKTARGTLRVPYELKFPAKYRLPIDASPGGDDGVSGLTAR